MIDKKVITQQVDLNECITQLEAVSQFSIDLEFDKNHFRYGFNLCLMQIFANGICYLIDPLSEELDIKTIFPVIEDPTKEKIVFSFGEDMRLLHSLGCFPKNIFDIAIAARLLNYAPSSLATTLDTILDIEINKSAQASDWFSRPLSPLQLKYAATDVLYLIELKDFILKEAEKLDRLDWIKQENAIWDELDYSNIDNNVFLRDKERKQLSIYEWYVFTQLMTLREAKAEELNRPSYRVLDKDYLLEMAQRPTQIHRFDKIKKIHRKLKTKEFKEELNTLLKKAIAQADTQKLSKEEKATQKLTEEEYLLFKSNKKRREEAKKSTFKPIQKLIIENLGEQIVALILNNKLIDDLALGYTQNLLPYKRDIIEKYANELSLNLREYFE